MTANDLSAYVPINSNYGFGLNPGYYGPRWSTQDIVTLGTTLGAKTFRMQLYDSFLSTYGLTSLVADYEKLKFLGAFDIAAMVGGVSEKNRWNPFNQVDQWNGQTYDAGKMFLGMYEPIWNPDGSVNTKNTFAKYLYDVVKTYGQYITYYEVWNEPDFTGGSGGWLGDLEPPAAGSWFDHDPAPEELTNLRATIPYYVRLLRISWEVIKSLYPSSHVCTGGLGNRSFLAALLRNTDNPNGGAVTLDYPLTAGAYFDVLSFHTYPEFSYDVKHWDNAVGGQVYNRHSDACLSGHFRYQTRFNDLLVQAGYDGVRMSRKHFICTETGTSRVMDNDNVGSSEIQRNYLLKCHIKTLMNGNIKQTYWYQTGDSGVDPDHWGAFGLFYYFGDNPPLTATASDQGKALSTLTHLLYGCVYDEAKTLALHLPSTVDGGAFKRPDGTYLYALWAKTTTDLSEQASATLLLPDALHKTTLWDGTTWDIGSSVALNATPQFVSPLASPPPSETYTGRKGYWILDQKRVYYKVYKFPDSSYQIKTGDYTWWKS